MKWSLALVLCCLFLHANSQSRFKYSLDWRKGNIILETGDTVACKLRYNNSLPEGIVQVLDGENVKCLSVKDLIGFSFHEKEKNRTRTFQRVTLEDGNHEQQFSFCEILYNNSTFSILKYRTVGVPYEHMHYSRFLRKHTIITERYILHQPTGKMLSLSKQNALNLMDKKRPEVNSFIMDNGIRFKSLSDYARVLDFHASL